jgi:hypothetical protein
VTNGVEGGEEESKNLVLSEEAATALAEGGGREGCAGGVGTNVLLEIFRKAMRVSEGGVRGRCPGGGGLLWGGTEGLC